jgi:hypothetical protein
MYWDGPGVDDVEFNPDASRKGKVDFFDIVSSGSGDVGLSLGIPSAVSCSPGACETGFKTASDVSAPPLVTTVRRFR